MAKQKSEKELIELVKTRARSYLKLPNVTSVGVGHRIADGKRTDELVIQFTVGKKLAPEVVAAEGLTLLPETITADDGTEVPVDVVERSYRPSFRLVEPTHATLLGPEEMTPAQFRRRRQDPIQPGISVSHIDGTAGTLGAIVFDAANGTPYILSNWHVLNGIGGAVGDLVVQPGPFDDANTAANGVGRLVRSHLGLAGDCAVCSIVGRKVDPRILELGVTPRRIAEAELKDVVVKSGRTTGVTYGIVRRTGVVVNIDYGEGEVEVGGFEIGPNPQKPAADGEISSGGDSGSAWMVDVTGADRDVMVGLHFAGETDPNPAEEHALACNIRSVLEKLQVTLVPSDSEALPHTPRRGARRKPARARG
jgi:endonuclease G